MKQIHVTMRDLYTDELVERAIDISNFTLTTGYVPDVEKQRDLLIDWIDQRANKQHNTDLTLVSWFIN